MRFGWTIALVVIAAPVVLGRQMRDAPDAEEVLRRVRGRLLADLERLPRYTCVQTITRRYYRPRSESASCSALMTAHEKQKDKLKLRGWDRLRLEVAIVEGDNVFSWVGAPRFKSGALEQLGGRGPLGSGDFGPFLHSILSRASVTFKGEMPAGNRRLLAYSYDMPVANSSYMVRTDLGWTATAYSGVFVIDPEAEDIVSLTVRTAELPESNPDCQAISEVDYGRTEIHDGKILIPRETRLTTLARNGSEVHTVTEYASCREYAAKSRILGAARGVETTPSTAPPAPVTPFPAGLHFHARIVTLIDSDRAAAGDPVEAVLRSPIRDKNHAELAPAGARLHARLVGMEQQSGFYFRISLQFESIELKGVAVPLRATADRSTRIDMSALTAPVFVSSEASTEDVTNMTFREQHLRLEKFDWSWTTLAAPAGDAGVNAP
jgi:hypothetical protein